MSVIHPDYKYNCIVIEVTRENFGDDRINYMYELLNSIGVEVSAGFTGTLRNYINDTTDGNPYIRIYGIGNKLTTSIGPMDKLKILSENNGYTYEKVFSFNNIKNIENIIKNGKSIITPSYTKREIVKENIIHPNYPYNIIVVGVNSESELKTLIKYLKLRRELFYHILAFINKFDSVYIVATIDDDNKLMEFVGYGRIVDIGSMDFKYEKLFNIDDVKNGLYEKILKDGVYNKPPSYTKREIVKESNEKFLNDRYPYDSIVIEISEKYFIEDNGIELVKEMLQKLLKNDFNSDKFHSLLGNFNKDDIPYVRIFKVEDIFKFTMGSVSRVGINSVNTQFTFSKVYTFDDITTITNILIPAPNYERKKIIKENIESYPYTSIVIGFYTIRDLDMFLQCEDKVPNDRVFGKPNLRERIINEFLGNEIPIYFKYNIDINNPEELISWGGWCNLAYRNT